MNAETDIPDTDENEIDGCDCPMNTVDEITPDEELPAADGGVE